jgi:hypothetical protein
MEKEKNIYDLKLHEIIQIKGENNADIEVVRVPGGWVYSFNYPGYRQSPIVFIPFSNEFQKINKLTK